MTHHDGTSDPEGADNANVSDHPRGRAPRRRTGAAQPASPRRRTHSRGRPNGARGGDRRPWPTAPTTTRLSSANPSSATTETGRTALRSRAATPTPATVWAADKDGRIDSGAAWPTPLVTNVVTSFTEPGERVLFVSSPRHEAAGDAGLTGVVHATELIGRHAQAEQLSVHAATTEPGSRPFWADLLPGAESAPTDISPLAGDRAPNAEAQVSGDTDLIITSVRPADAGNRLADLLALFAARRLRTGGILAVLTHCDWTSGELIDPTGPIVAAGQNADLLYLQHIVAVHHPVRDGAFDVPTVRADDPSGADDSVENVRARHRAQVRGLPVPHQRIHSDVLVFAQPSDHRPAHQTRPPLASLPAGGDR